MTRLLFVDDEPRILDGLRDLLRRERKRWDMQFALGGEAGVAALEREHFDVVVSDMRMPKVDGGRVLEAARRLRPEAGRIILSGQTELEAAMRVVPVAHQFLTKPCDGDLLKAVIVRVLDLMSLVRSLPLQRLVGGVEALPAAPIVYTELRHVLASERAAAKEVALVLERDAALCAKVLQLTNSAFFGLKRTVTSVETAVAFLGVETLRSLVLAVGSFTAMASPDNEELVARLQARAVAAGEIARVISWDCADRDAIFAAAVMHDVGRLLLATKLGATYAQIEARAQSTGEPLAAIEQEVLGVSHAEVGAYLLGLWGLPANIVEAVRFHHEPWSAPPSNGVAKRAGMAVLLADDLGSRAAEAPPEAWATDGLFADAVARVALHARGSS